MDTALCGFTLLNMYAQRDTADPKNFHQVAQSAHSKQEFQYFSNSILMYIYYTF